MPTEWILKTPYGEVHAVKSRSYGEKTWREPEPEKKYGVTYWQGQQQLQRDVFAKVNNKWIPAKGNDQYAKRVDYAEWTKQGKPKTIEGKKLGIVVKKIMAETKYKGTGEASMIFNARVEMPISRVELRRLVTEDAKFIIPTQQSIPVYREVYGQLNSKGAILITDAVQISKNSSVFYVYGIVPINGYLVMIELLDEELAKSFPPDALIPQETPVEIDNIEEEAEGLI